MCRSLDVALIEAELGGGSLFSAKISALGVIDSTNTQLKRWAEEGAPEGTVLLAEGQTGGRGTRGRSFFSAEGEGLYVSVLFRPGRPAAELFTLTGWAAAAVRRGIETASGAPVEIKWLNDIYLGGKKVCGILTELSPLKGDGTADYVVLGVGVNVSQTAETFRTLGLDTIAVSLGEAGCPVRREVLCAAVLRELENMYLTFPREENACLEEYRAHCLTVGRAVTFEEGGRVLRGTALTVEEGFGLKVLGEDGRERTVTSGTVSLT